MATRSGAVVLEVALTFEICEEEVKWKTLKEECHLIKAESRIKETHITLPVTTKEDDPLIIYSFFSPPNYLIS